MIVADTISGLCLSAICTGGGGATAGKGSYGGYNGGAAVYHASSGSIYRGGSSGWAFIYCNNAVNQDTTNITYEN